MKSITDSKFYREVFGASAAFVVIALLTKGFSLVVSFLLAGLISVEDYGNVNLLMAMSYGLGLIMALGMTAIPFRFCYQLDISSFKILIKAQKVLFTFSLFFVGIATIAFSKGWQKLFSNMISEWPFQDAIIFIAYSALAMSVTILSHYFRAQKALKTIAYLDSLKVLAGFIFGVIFFALISRPIGYLLGNAIIFALILIVILAKFSPKVVRKDKAIIRQIPSYRQLLSFSIPFIPIAFAGWGQSFVDRAIIVAKLNPFDLGVYTFAIQVSAGIYTILGTVNQALIPLYVKTELGLHRRQLKYVLVIISLVLFSFVGVAITVWTQTNVLTKYQLGAGVAVIRSLIIFPAAIQFHFSNIIAYKNAQHNFLFISQILGILVNIFLGLLLSVKYGLYGVALSSIAGYASTLLATILYYLIISRHDFRRNIISG